MIQDEKHFPARIREDIAPLADSDVVFEVPGEERQDFIRKYHQGGRDENTQGEEGREK